MTPTESPNPSPAVYPSAIDWWIAAIFLMTPLAMLVGGVALIFAVPAAGVALILVSFLIEGVIIALSFPCRYELLESELLIVSGLMRQRIPYSRIRSAELSSELAAGPALSLKRIRIQLDQGFRLISPKDREAFLKELNRRRGGS